MLRKLIFFAITSGLAKKAYSMYQAKNGVSGPLAKNASRAAAVRPRFPFPKSDAS